MSSAQEVNALKIKRTIDALIHAGILIHAVILIHAGDRPFSRGGTQRLNRSGIEIMPFSRVTGLLTTVTGLLKTSAGVRLRG